MTRPTRSDTAPRGLGVNEDTVRRWEQRGLIRAEVLPGSVRPVLHPELAAFRGGQLTGFPEAHEEDLPAVHVRGTSTIDRGD